MITQQVNLYQSRFQRQRPAFSAALTASAVAALLLVQAMASGYGYWQLQRAQELRAGLEAEAASWRGRLAQIQQNLQQIRTDKQHEQALRRAQQEVAARRQVLASLSALDRPGNAGFSDFLEGLARRRVDGLWLTRIGIAEAGRDLELSGSALQPELLPKFIAAIGNEPSYRGRQFKTLHMERPAESAAWVDFALATVTEPVRP